MGQQQLLLLVMGIIIVGVAVILGFIMFDDSNRQFHVDLLMNHATHVATDAIAWRSRRSPFLGGGQAYDELDEEGMARMLMTDTRLPGKVVITKASGDDLEITAISFNYDEVGVLVVVKGMEIVHTAVAYDDSINLPDSK